MYTVHKIADGTYQKTRNIMFNSNGESLKLNINENYKCI